MYDKFSKEDLIDTLQYRDEMIKSLRNEVNNIKSLSTVVLKANSNLNESLKFKESDKLYHTALSIYQGMIIKDTIVSCSIKVAFDSAKKFLELSKQYTYSDIKE